MRWVDLVLRLYPQAFRDARTEEVEEFVRMELEGAGLRRPLVVVRLATDLALGAWRMRRSPARAGHGKGEGWMGGTMRDLAFAARGLARSRGFTVVVVATLALGVGLDTSVFSVVNGVLLRPLAYEHADQLVYLRGRSDTEHLSDVLFSGGDWRMLREAAKAISSLEAVAVIRQNLNGAGLPRQVEVGWVSPGFLRMLGAAPELGRTFRPDDPPGTVVLSHALWQDALAGDRNVLGRSVRLDGHPYTIVGVMPAGFRLELPEREGDVPAPEIWKNPDGLWQNGDVWSAQGPEFGILRLVGRLRGGATVGEAQAQVDAAVAALRARDGRYQKVGLDVRVEGLQAQVVRHARPTLLILMGGVAFVLLVACANVAGLLLVRGQGRRRETAVRVALGAPGSRLARLFLLESLLLALLGGGVGLGLSAALVHLAPILAPPGLPRVHDIRMDGTVVAYALGTALLVTLLVGVAPALRARRADPAAELRSGRVAGRHAGRLRDGLVVLQVALSLVLVVGTGLLTESLLRLRAVDPGFEAKDLFSFGVSIPGTRYGWPDEAGRFYRRLQERVAEIPGVESAGVVWPLPSRGTWSGEVEAGAGDPRPLGVTPYYLATEEYFGTAEIPVKDGRLFQEDDPDTVAVISEAVARRAFPEGRAVGRTIRANPWGPGMRDFKVIGVVGDVRAQDLRSPTQGGVYFDARSWSWVDWEVHVVARSAIAPAALVPAVRQTVAGLDPEVPVAHPEMVEERLEDQTASTRFVLGILGLFALSSVALALLGVYGMISYVVGQRRREIGIRLAVGSRRSGIETLVLRRGLVVSGIGIAFGLGAAWLLGGLLRSLLFGIRPDDPLTLALAALGMTVAGAAASWIPARRASRMDPVRTLRTE